MEGVQAARSRSAGTGPVPPRAPLSPWQESVLSPVRLLPDAALALRERHQRGECASSTSLNECVGSLQVSHRFRFDWSFVRIQSVNCTFANCQVEAHDSSVVLVDIRIQEFVRMRLPCARLSRSCFISNITGDRSALPESKKELFQSRFIVPDELLYDLQEVGALREDLRVLFPVRPEVLITLV